MSTVDRINERRALRAKVSAEVDILDAEISDLIRQALKEGLGPTELAKQIGISRARIYQIRDGSR
jgi:DNA-directed RNA polymerase specialized sigma subunit